VGSLTCSNISTTWADTPNWSGISIGWACSVKCSNVWTPDLILSPLEILHAYADTLIYSDNLLPEWIIDMYNYIVTNRRVAWLI
jgi:hypothetical protein